MMSLLICPRRARRSGVDGALVGRVARRLLARPWRSHRPRGDRDEQYRLAHIRLGDGGEDEHIGCGPLALLYT